MDKNIIVEEIKENYHKITYKGKIFGIVEHRRVYGNKYYYAHIGPVAAEYNTFEDAVSHLFWCNGYTIARANELAGIK